MVNARLWGFGGSLGIRSALCGWIEPDSLGRGDCPNAVLAVLTVVFSKERRAGVGEDVAADRRIPVFSLEVVVYIRLLFLTIPRRGERFGHRRGSRLLPWRRALRRARARQGLAKEAASCR